MDYTINRHRYGGLDLYDFHDFHARQYDPLIPGFNGPDKHAEKYYWLSPYSYCAGNPINNIDIDGNDKVPLLKPSGAHGMGHMAVLIQHEDKKYYLYSKNGTAENHGIKGPENPNNKNDDGGGYNMTEGGYDSVDDFLKSPANQTESGEPKYTSSVVISTTSDQDAAAVDAARGELNKDYNLVGSNCAKTVQNALDAASKVSGGNPIPKCKPKIPLLRKIPKIIFNKIVRNNAKIEESKKEHKDNNKND